MRAKRPCKSWGASQSPFLNPFRKNKLFCATQKTRESTAQITDHLRLEQEKTPKGKKKPSKQTHDLGLYLETSSKYDLFRAGWNTIACICVLPRETGESKESQEAMKRAREQEQAVRSRSRGLAQGRALSCWQDSVPAYPLRARAWGWSSGCTVPPGLLGQLPLLQLAEVNGSLSKLIFPGLSISIHFVNSI